MTDREVMQQALEALELEATRTPIPETAAAMHALRARLAEPEPEPVAVGHLVSPYGEWKPNFNLKCKFPAESLEWSIPLYFHPPTRRPLTDEEILRLLRPTVWAHVEGHNRTQMLADARAIERKITGGNDE